jgi:hypothetical protein
LVSEETTNPQRILHAMKIPSTAATPGWYSGAWFELNKSGPTMLPTARPALTKEMAKDFLVCPGTALSMAVSSGSGDGHTAIVGGDPSVDEWVATKEKTDAVVAEQQTALEVCSSPETIEET